MSTNCCDLLEKSYFCSIANNLNVIAFYFNWVVICLKNRTFAVSQTTNYSMSFYWFSCDLLEKSYFCSIANNNFKFRMPSFELWFAWKIVLLQYRKQQRARDYGITRRCDLLEKSYFCSIANNVISLCPSAVMVVICLENRTFAVSQTTAFPKLRRLFLLWFAWKIVLLQYRKQLTCLPLCVMFVVICLKNRTFAVSQTTFFDC